MDGAHALVRVQADEPDELVGKLADELDDAVVVGPRAVGGFAVPAGDDRPLDVVAVEVGDDLGDRLGLHLRKIDRFAEPLEHLAVLDAGEHLGGVRPEPEIDDLHYGPLSLDRMPASR